MAPHESIRMFALCSSMKWAHLPNAGGVYDQDPDLLDKFMYLFQKIAEHEKAERQKQERESKQKSGSSGRGSRPVRVRNR